MNTDEIVEEATHKILANIELELIDRIDPYEIGNIWERLKPTIQNITKTLLTSEAQKREEAAGEAYQELIMAVESKFEGETRHETALRYITHAEQRATPPTEDN